jgi:hypothetical protein
MTYQALVLTVGLSLTATLAAVAPADAGSVCPALGDDTDCGAIITITNTGSSISFTGQGPYDGIDDTMVGVVNNSNQPIYAMGLTSTANIFGFDGDGIDTYGAPGNSQDGTGYGGPDAHYSNINAGATAGVVNFNTPIAAKGGTTYFSLENALSSPTAIQDIVNGAISVSLTNRFSTTAFGLLNLFRPLTINASFTPNGGLTLQQAEQDTGFIDLDWIQKITIPGPSPFFAYNNGGTPTNLVGTINDPPQGGGYTYELKHGYPNGDYAYPFYFAPFNGEGQESSSTLSFSDTPADPCLPGGNSAGVQGCNGKNAPAGSQLSFQTDLVGILPGFSAGTNCITLLTCIDLGVGFSWTDSFNGTAGGISQTKGDLPIDPGSGLGGASLISITETTDYEPFNVVTVNGNPVGSSVPEPRSASLLVVALLALCLVLRVRKAALFGNPV